MSLYVNFYIACLIGLASIGAYGYFVSRLTNMNVVYFAINLVYSIVTSNDELLSYIIRLQFPSSAFCSLKDDFFTEFIDIEQ